MRNFIIPALISILFFSCASERRIIDNTVIYSDDIEAVAARIFRMHTSQTFINEDDLDGLRLTAKEERLIKGKIRCPNIFVKYNDADTTVTKIDSLVIFKRGGYYGKQYHVIVDMRKEPRESIGCSGCQKLTDRIYYMFDRIPIPMM